MGLANRMAMAGHCLKKSLQMSYARQSRRLGIAFEQTMEGRALHKGCVRFICINGEVSSANTRKEASMLRVLRYVIYLYLVDFN